MGPQSGVTQSGGLGWVQMLPLRSVPEGKLTRNLSSGLGSKTGSVRDDVLGRKGALAKEGSFGSRSRSVTFQDLPVCQDGPPGPDRYPPAHRVNVFKTAIQCRAGLEALGSPEHNPKP